MEESKQSSGQTDVTSGTPENTEIVKNPDAVLAKNRELLKEKQSIADELATTRAELDRINDDKKIAEGNKDEVINSLRTKLADIESKSKTKENKFNWNTVSSHIKEAALLKGCTSPDKLIKLLDKNDLKSLQLYDDYSVNKDDLNSLIEKAMQDHSDIGLFKKNVTINDKVPSGKIPTGAPPTTLQDKLNGMSRTEFNNYIKNLSDNEPVTN